MSENVEILKEIEITDKPKKISNMMGYLMGLMGQKLEVNTFELGVDEKIQVDNHNSRSISVKRHKKDIHKTRQSRKKRKGWA